MIYIVKQIVVRTKRFEDGWSEAPNNMLIQVLNMGYQVVMANPIGNELEYILEKAVSDESDDKSEDVKSDYNIADIDVGLTRYPDDMDKECIPLCDLFNSIGLTTQSSCCGHGESPFQIIFADDVGNEQIDCFFDKLWQEKNQAPMIGRFLQWKRKVDGKIVSNWIYQVDKIEWANLDMSKMWSVIKHRY